jgi:hypothetical protein
MKRKEKRKRKEKEKEKKGKRCIKRNIAFHMQNILL